MLPASRLPQIGRGGLVALHRKTARLWRVIHIAYSFFLFFFLRRSNGVRSELCSDIMKAVIQIAYSSGAHFQLRLQSESLFPHDKSGVLQSCISAAVT